MTFSTQNLPVLEVLITEEHPLLHSFLREIRNSVECMLHSVRNLGPQVTIATTIKAWIITVK